MSTGKSKAIYIIVVLVVIDTCLCGFSASSVLLSSGVAFYQGWAEIDVSQRGLIPVPVAVSAFTQSPFATHTTLPTYTSYPTYTTNPPTTTAEFTEPPTETPTPTNSEIPNTQPSASSTLTLAPTRTSPPIFTVSPSQTTSPSLTLLPSRNVGAILDEKGCICTSGLPDRDPLELDCDDFDNDWSLAQACYLRCYDQTGIDVYELDGDDPQNGEACEHLHE